MGEQILKRFLCHLKMRLVSLRALHENKSGTRCSRRSLLAAVPLCRVSTRVCTALRTSQNGHVAIYGPAVQNTCSGLDKS